MSKKKHPNLPNGYGSIKHLSGNRTNPYAVYPPCTERDADGRYVTPPAICYVRDWYVGFLALSAWHAGKYTPGMEKSLYERLSASGGMYGTTQALISEFSGARQGGPTFSELYERFSTWKMDSGRELAKSTRYGYVAAFKRCAVLHDRPYAEISYLEMQAVVDECPLGYTAKRQVVSLLRQMARYAKVERIIPDLSSVELLTVKTPNDNEPGVPFSERELRILWEHSGDRTVQLILIMCYSGYRVGELEVVEVDLARRAFRGGLKTKSGKSRVVPIHSAILPFVQETPLLSVTVVAFRNRMYAVLDELGLDRHTPHDCRHTFSMLCERYGVRENDRKRLLGHAFHDVTNSVYGHRDIEDLRAEIEKIKK